MSFKPITVNTPATDPAHILAQDDAILYHGIIGQDCVLDIGSKMEAVMIDNNTVRVLDGAVMVQGHLGHIPHGEYEDLHIENGVAGQKRHDLIVARFETTAGIDTYELAVIKGMPGTSGVDPDITTGNLNAGDMLREYPLYRVKIDGFSLASVESVHTVGSTIGVLHQTLESHLADYENKVVICKKDMHTPGSSVTKPAYTIQLPGQGIYLYSASVYGNDGDPNHSASGIWLVTVILGSSNKILSSELVGTIQKTGNALGLELRNPNADRQISLIFSQEYARRAEFHVQATRILEV